MHYLLFVLLINMAAIKLLLTLVVFSGLPCTVRCTAAGINATSTSAPTKRRTTPASATTQPSESCEDRRSCNECTKHVKCYWCGANEICKEYPTSKIVPRDCSWNKWYWKQCTVPGYVLIIVVSVVCGVILLSIGCCIYCCCCRSRNSQYMKEDSKFRCRKEEMRQRNAERRAKRKLKTDAIRKKYGLLKNDDDVVA